MFKIFGFYRKYSWEIISLLFFIATLLGFLAFIGQRTSWLDALYDAIRLYPMESFDVADPNILYQIARWLAPITLCLFIYNTVILLAKDKMTLFQLRTIKGHTIICGLGNVGQQIAEDFLKANQKIVIIECDETNDYISYFKEKNVVVLNENAADDKILKKAKVNCAINLISVTPDDKLNVEIAYNSSKINNKIKNLAHVSDSLFKELFVTQDIMKTVSLFNINEIGMRIMLKKYPPDSDSFKSVMSIEDESPEILIIGFGKIGEHLLRQLCITAYYINNKPSNITIISDHLDQKRAVAFNDIYSTILKEESLLNISFEHCEIYDLNTDSLENIVSKKSIDVAYLCIEDEINQFKIATNIEIFFENNAIPIVFCMPKQSGLMPLLKEKYNNHKNVNIFNIVEESCDYKVLINEDLDVMAKACNQNYCDKNPPGNEWSDLTNFHRYSNLSQADHIEVKLRAIGCPLSVEKNNVSDIVEFYNSKIIDDKDKIEQLAEMEHRRWMGVYIINGWVYNPIRNDLIKHHDCIVSWSKLNDSSKQKDRNHINAIPDILEKIN